MATPLPRVRSENIKQQDVPEHGPTSGCPGCRAATAGMTAQPHTEACRARLEEEIAANPEGADPQRQAETRIMKAAQYIERETIDGKLQQNMPP